MISELPILETERLILRPMQLTDAPIVQKLAGAPEIASTTLNIPHPYPEGAAEEFIQWTLEQAQTGEQYVFAITRKADGEFLGTIGLGIDKRHHKAEVGYWLGVPYWGQGYMTEATKALIRFGFARLSLNRIFASHFTRNPASGRVMQKAGMRYEGIQRQAVRKDDRYEDLAFYAIVKED